MKKVKNIKFILVFLLFLVLVIYLMKFNRKNFSQFNFVYDKNKKLKIYDECKYDGKGFNKNFEVGECSIAIQIIPHVKNVLEIGGGAGKVSHMINKILKKRNLEKKHIVIEPGEGIYNFNQRFIYKNKKNFNDSYTILEKFAEDLVMDDLLLLDKKPDCLYVDCEGCLHKFFETEIGKYCLKQARFLVNERDSMVINKNIEDLNIILKDNGYKLIATGYGCGINCFTDVWYKDVK